MSQRKHKGDGEEHHNGDGNQNALGRLLQLLHVAFYPYLGSGSSNPAIKEPRTRAAQFLRFAMVAVNSFAVLYWETAWKDAATQSEGVVARSTSGSRLDQVGITQDLILQYHL